MKSNEIRKTFLNYFKKRDHQIVSSSSLIPANDPTLLFINAGMVQFKDVFLGNEKRPYKRAASAQRCVRAGGKHNDLDNVGYTARHHTFFEMLGNFSFGDYFKRTAIEYAWRFLTEVLQISPEKLWVTVFLDDDEAADIWLNELKINPKRFTRCGEKDNFWSMGEIGPCGPCSEIFYDHGSEIAGGPPGSTEEEGDRYVEIWNLVFMEYNRDEKGNLVRLPSPSVDTGMGLERVAAVMQGVHSNYDIDIFRQLIQTAAKLLDTQQLNHHSLRVIADHIRACAFLITDGVRPSNEGRGYVLRRIIRRAIRHGHKLGHHKPFFYQLVAPLVEEMGAAYPELINASATVEKILLREEEQFARTLQSGLNILERELLNLKEKIIPGELIFRLYDTYGFPPDLTGDIAREHGLTLDYKGFESEMSKQRKQSQAASQFGLSYEGQLDLEGETEFIGYESMSAETQVITLLSGEERVDVLKKDEEGAVVLNCTPFYAEAGGQVGDKGQLYFEGGRFRVDNTIKQGLVYIHKGVVEEGAVKVGTEVSAEVSSKRIDIVLHHSATHLLHSALRRILGEHVIQKGSLVEAARLRFDFAHTEPLTTTELEQIERLVNQQIRANLPSTIQFMHPEKAKQIGALALFEEKYGDKARVVSMGEFSRELCGGTHVDHTGEIGFFKIISETGIAAGIRRIEALAGERAIDWVMQNELQLKELSGLLKTHRDETVNKCRQMIAELHDKEKTIAQLKQGQMAVTCNELQNQIIEVKGVQVIAAKIPDADSKVLRDMVDRLKQTLEKAVILLATVSDNKVQLVAGVTDEIKAQLKAGDLMRVVAEKIGGKGGGRPDMAQGGGNDVQALDSALASVKEWVEGKR